MVRLQLFSVKMDSHMHNINNNNNNKEHALPAVKRSKVGNTFRITLATEARVGQSKRAGLIESHPHTQITYVCMRVCIDDTLTHNTCKPKNIQTTCTSIPQSVCLSSCQSVSWRLSLSLSISLFNSTHRTENLN